MGATSSGRSVRRFAVILTLLVLAGACITAATWAAPSAEEAQPADEVLVEAQSPTLVASDDATLTHAEWLAANPRPEELVPNLKAMLPAPATGTAGDAAAAEAPEQLANGYFPEAPLLDFFPNTGVMFASDLEAVDIAASNTTTAYIVYTKHGTATGTDIVLSKNVGDAGWQRTYDGPAHGEDYAGAVTVRGSAIYVAGDRQTKYGDSDLVLMRWNTSGERIWTRSYDSGDHFPDIAADVAVDGDGNVAVIGLSASWAGGWDWVVASYKADGTRRWVRRYDGPAHLDDVPLQVQIDSSGRIYVCGYSASATNSIDALLIKYSKAGDRLWARRVNGAGDGIDYAQAMTARPGGGVYIAGATMNGTGMICGLLRGYAADGSLVLNLVDTGGEAPESEGVYYNDVTVSGDIFCGGSQYVTGVGWQRLLVAVAPDEASIARQVELCPTSPWGCEITAVEKDSQGGVFAAGTWVSDEAESQFLVERIHRGGTSWKSLWPTDSPLPLDLDGANYVRAIAVKGVNAYILGQYYIGPDEAGSFFLGYVY